MQRGHSWRGTESASRFLPNWVRSWFNRRNPFFFFFFNGKIVDYYESFFDYESILLKLCFKAINRDRDCFKISSFIFVRLLRCSFFFFFWITFEAFLRISIEWTSNEKERGKKWTVAAGKGERKPLGENSRPDWRKKINRRGWKMKKKKNTLKELVRDLIAYRHIFFFHDFGTREKEKEKGEVGGERNWQVACSPRPIGTHFDPAFNVMVAARKKKLNNIIYQLIFNSVLRLRIYFSSRSPPPPENCYDQRLTWPYKMKKMPKILVTKAMKSEFTVIDMEKPNNLKCNKFLSGELVEWTES